MSQEDDKGKYERSVKLCHLVFDRQTNREIDHEIRKLLEEGVLINFQDQNRNKKTAIHLAVEKCDVACVKLLLQFKPSLEVKDEDGKTPIELAKFNGFDDIHNVLLESSIDVVNELYVEVFHYENLTRQKIEAIKLRATFKVLKLINCPSVNDVWAKLNDHDYATTFNESSHFFFIAIETNEANIENDLELMQKVLIVRRPMIVQLSSSNSENTKIYIKDEKKEFVEIPDTTQLTQKEFDEAVQSGDDCSMKLLVAALRSNLFGHLTGDFLDTKLNANEDRNKAVNKFARSNALCHRFLKLFNENQPEIDTIVAALSFKGDQSLLALLDLPFELNDGKVKLTEYQQDIMSVVDCCGCNLLMMAAEKNNLDAVKLLLRCRCDFNHFDCGEKRASDICWEVKAFDCLAVLIEAGSPYPNNFCDFSTEELSESTEAFRRIDAMTEAINSFHEIIKDGKIEEVKNFITNHPHIKHAYDTKNKCALTLALLSKEVEIHSLLMSEGFEPGADDEYQSACSKSKFRNKIRNSHRKYFKEAFDEPHLKRLLEKSRLSFGSKDRANCSTIIRKMFDELNEIDEVIPILQICSTSDKLKIVFDFNCDSVREMDPSKGPRTLGVVYLSEGFVYIGAKNHKAEFCKVIGTLIHELTHYAMQMTYNNICKPYDEDDIAQTNRFVEITTETKQICNENPSTDSIVTRVFKNYEKEVWHQELIVRVPQLLAHYKINSIALKAAKRNTPELFHFFREKTLKDVEAQSKVLNQKYLVSKINKQTGIARKNKHLKIHFENVGINLKPSVNVITSNAPQLTLALLNQVFKPDSHIFVTLEQVATGNVLDKIAKVNVKESSTTLIVDCIGLAQKYSASLRNLPKRLKNLKTIALVITENEGSAVIKKNFSKVKPKTFNHKWDELTESTKVILLKKLVNFQGVKMALSRLVEPSSETMNFFPLRDILDDKDLKIGNELHQTSHNFYIPRKLIKKDTANARGFEELIKDDTTIDVMIISDEAGSGKSVMLFEIAKYLLKVFPDWWVLFVDLKRYIESFKCVDDYKTIKSFLDFIVQHILKDETELDKELFKEMFRAGKTFVLFDGLDEISPNFKDLLLHVLKLFKSGSGNRLHITTRPQLEVDLEKALGNFVFKLEKLSEEFQKSYLVQYWKSAGSKIDKDLEVLSKRLLKKLNISRRNFIGLPLLLRISAEIFSAPNKGNLLDKLETLNLASIYREFVDKYLARWKETGSEIAWKENVEIEMAGGILEIHHSIAMNHKFGGWFSILEFNECDVEKIARVGLVRYDKTKKTFQFIHETFAEYFVADFIWFHLKRKNQNPKHDCRLATEIFIEVVQHNFSYPVIHTFLNQTLETTKLNLNEASCQFLGEFVGEVVNSQSDFDILSASLAMHGIGNEISILLLSILKYTEKAVLLKMLESEDGEYKTALRIAAEDGSSEIVSLLCNLITTCVDIAKRILLAIKYSENVLFWAARNKNRGVLTALCEVLNSVCTRDEIKFMFQHKRDEDNIIDYSARESGDEAFNELIALLPNYLTVEELKKLLTGSDCFNRNCLHHAVAKCTIERVQRIINFVKSIFDTEEDQKIFLRQLGDEERNIFQYAAQNKSEKIFETIVESCDVLSNEDFKTMLMEKDSAESNVLHLITRCDNEIMLKELKSLLRDRLSNDDLKSMLLEKDSEGSNVLHIVTKCGNEIRLKELNSLLREYLSGDDVRNLLLQVNKKGENCFRLAANNNKINFHVFLETIGNLLAEEDQTRLLQESSLKIDIFQLASGDTDEDIPIDIIKYLLTKMDITDAPQGAAFKYYVERWNRLVAFLQARFSIDEMKNFLMQYDSDRDGESCFHLAVYKWFEGGLCEAVCETFKSLLSVEEQRKSVQQKYSDEKNVFHHATSDQETLKVVIEYLSAILSRDEIKVMLKQKDCEGQNCFQYSLKYDISFSEIIRSLSNFIKTILDFDDQRKFFGSENLFHLAIENQCEEIFSIVHECLKGVFTDIEIESIIQEEDSNGNNILHLACQIREDGHWLDLYDLFTVLTHVLDADELKDFLTSSNNHGSNCLLLAIKIGPKYFVEDILEFIQTKLSSDDLQSIIRKHDYDGKNILMCASQNNDTKMFPFVKRFAKKYLSEDQFAMLHDEFTRLDTSAETEKEVRVVVAKKA